LNEQVILDFTREAVYVVIISSAPLLMLALIVGLVVSIFQTITSIQEQTLAFVPKILAVFLGIIIFGPFMGRIILDFFVNTMQNIDKFIN
jgi:flagellar biosynthetic protein FliQ